MERRGRDRTALSLPVGTAFPRILPALSFLIFFAHPDMLKTRPFPVYGPNRDFQHVRRFIGPSDKAELQIFQVLCCLAVIRNVKVLQKGHMLPDVILEHGAVFAETVNPGVTIRKVGASVLVAIVQVCQGFVVGMLEGIQGLNCLL